MLSGKVDDKVYVDSPKYGPHLRNAGKGVKRKEEPAFKRQHSRTKFLNDLASELKAVLQAYCGDLMRSDFYRTLLKRFRKEPENNRVLLLWHLKDMDINQHYPMNKLGDQRVTESDRNKHIAVNLQVLIRPPRGKYEADYYSYEVIVLCWDKSSKPAVHARQYSEWITIKGELPEFEFLFPKPPGTTHYMVCLRQQLGDKFMKPVESFVGTAIQVTNVGSFNKREAEMLSKKIAEEKAKERGMREDSVMKDVPRVKAKQTV